VELVRRWSQWWRTSELPVARWLRAAHAALLGEMPILAAGTALFAIIAVVPTLAAGVALYAIVADPSKIQAELGTLDYVLPTEVVAFLGEQLARQAQRSNNELGIALAVSVVIAMISARGSARALIDSLNRAYRVREIRKPSERLVLSLAMAATTVVGVLAMFVVIVALPGITSAINPDWTIAARWLRWPILLAVVFVALFALYRYAPSPRPLGTKRVVWRGALVGTLLLVLVSWGFALWVDRIARAELIYGAFGSVIVTILWFYLSTLTLVIGGFVNAELERQAGAPDPDRSMY
jgi:membrane protein